MFSIANSTSAGTLGNLPRAPASLSSPRVAQPELRLPAMLRGGAPIGFDDGPLGNLTTREVETLVDILNDTEHPAQTAEEFLLRFAGSGLPVASRPPSLDARDGSDACFMSLGEFDMQHPDADAATLPSASASMTSVVPGNHVWHIDPEEIGAYDGLNLVGYAVRRTDDYTVERAQLGCDYRLRLDGEAGTLARIRVDGPDGPLSTLLVGAQSPSAQFDIRVRTGGDQCVGKHRVIPCEPTGSLWQCDVTFDRGVVDGQRTILVEIYSKTTGPIEFFVR